MVSEGERGREEAAGNGMTFLLLGFSPSTVVPRKAL